jgi:hypothetical protein
MGYTTYFEGEFTLDKPLTQAQGDYLRKFAETRRMKRNPAVTERREDPLREAVGLPVGEDGCFFVGSEGVYGQERDVCSGVVEYNSPPDDQPGLWCQWTVGDDNDTIVWDGGEKFYNYEDWLAYIVANFLEPWGRTLNGEVEWSGEEHGDFGKIVVEDNITSSLFGRIVYEQNAQWRI